MFTQLTAEHAQPENTHKAYILASHILHYLLGQNKPSGVDEIDEKNLEQLQHAALVMANAAIACYENGKQDIYLYQKNHVFCLINRETRDSLEDGENALFLDIISSCIDSFFAEFENDTHPYDKELCEDCEKNPCVCEE